MMLLLPYQPSHKFSSSHLITFFFAHHLDLLLSALKMRKTKFWVHFLFHPAADDDDRDAERAKVKH